MFTTSSIVLISGTSSPAFSNRSFASGILGVRIVVKGSI